MNQESFSRIRDWVEPAHPGVIEHYEDLLAIYKLIRQSLQEKIDASFDQVSRNIGFVVTTTLPAMLEVAADGKVKSFALTGAHLKGTIFETHFKDTLSLPGPIPGAPGNKFVRPGSYYLYLVWFDALRLRLRRDWMEPAHFRVGQIAEQLQQARQVRPEQRMLVDREVTEPAHWFDRGTILEVDDILIISVLDEVYPELHLAEQVAGFRQGK
jgi:hypothetical protein